jgi:hypothetical protein
MVVACPRTPIPEPSHVVIGALVRGSPEDVVMMIFRTRSHRWQGAVIGDLDRDALSGLDSSDRRGG